MKDESGFWRGVMSIGELFPRALPAERLDTAEITGQVFTLAISLCGIGAAVAYYPRGRAEFQKELAGIKKKAGRFPP